MRVVQKIVSLIQILDLFHISHLHMGLTYREIETEIETSFSSFIRNSSVLKKERKMFNYGSSFWVRLRNF